ncbi:hypothetical protein AB0F91_34665 [Amycolatopsis sp. NPDC023774]|uniref:hypothetical protein n=1 Tax=Amycolatopsis sp. NPDC023774 TaxID=3155015 RepID=UPI0033E0867B
MQYFTTGDPEPQEVVAVLLHHVRTADERRYLARFQHGWRWVDSRTELERRDKTPLTWRFATAAGPGGEKTELRVLTDAEQIDWLAS